MRGSGRCTVPWLTNVAELIVLYFAMRAVKMPASGAHWRTFHTQSHLKVRPLWNSCFRLALTLILTYHTLVYFLCASFSSVTFNCHHWFLFGVFPRCFLLRLISSPTNMFLSPRKTRIQVTKIPWSFLFSPHWYAQPSSWKYNIQVFCLSPQIINGSFRTERSKKKKRNCWTLIHVRKK